MTDCKCGDIVLVDVVFSDGLGIKKSPALIISSDEYHESRQEVIVAVITSNIHRILCGDTKIKEWEEAGLVVPSVVTGVIQTVKAAMIDRKLGVLRKGDFQRVQKNLNKALEL
ncbi:MAG: type II toxin-antitoxin system PemK/MazF family toxin [Candidatus Omnitrophota bacterium]